MIICFLLLPLPLLSSRRCCVALHPFRAVVPWNQPSAPAASFGPGQSYASLLEHREPVCPPRLVLHPPSPPFLQHWGWKLPVDYRGWIVVLTQKSSCVKTDKSCLAPVLFTFLQLQVKQNKFEDIFCIKTQENEDICFCKWIFHRISMYLHQGRKLDVYILLCMDESE